MAALQRVAGSRLCKSIMQHNALRACGEWCLIEQGYVAAYTVVAAASKQKVLVRALHTVLVSHC